MEVFKQSVAGASIERKNKKEIKKKNPNMIAKGRRERKE